MIRVRFAPSPTGYLHLGNMRTALFNYLFARREGGKFILRVEDTDLERSRPEYELAQQDDLRWMGIQWDEGPVTGGPYGPYRQSERLDIYKEHIGKLIERGAAYYCYVTEAETEEMKLAARLENRPPRFDNRGRHFTQEEIRRRQNSGIRPTVRFKIENPRLVLQDLVRGEVSFNLDDMVGDFVIQRADGMPTFHLVVCVDDALMKVTHVFRGEDHLSNTPKHLLLFQAMGYAPPQYGHLALVNGPGGEPLSKRLDSISIRQFRNQGYLPEAVANYIALLGWSPGENREIVGWDELQKIFDITRVSRSSSNFDPDKMNWVNGEHIRLLSDEVFADRALNYLKSRGTLKFPEDQVQSLLPVFKDNVERFDQLDDRLEILNDHFEYHNAEWIRSEKARAVFETSLQVLDEVGGEDFYPAFLEQLKKKVPVKGKDLMMPLRMALTGREHGPEMKRFLSILGKEKVKARFLRALSGV